jgi:hypothetical protein
MGSCHQGGTFSINNIHLFTVVVYRFFPMVSYGEVDILLANGATPGVHP